MKRVIIIVLIVVIAVMTMNAKEAVKGLSDGFQQKTGNIVEFTFMVNATVLKIESSRECEYSAKMIADNHPSNLFGFCWQIEGPEGAKAKATITISKDLLKGNEIPDNIYITRIHNGLGYLVSEEDISIAETVDSYVISVENIDQFSIWGIFGSNPPVPTLTEWTAILFGSLLLAVGGWFVWRKII